MKRKRGFGGRAAAQQGVALIVVLVLLLVITLLGLASMRGTLLQERMAANLVARSQVFQAAEATLREAEAYLAENAPVPPDTGCDAGICAMPEATAAPRWETDGFWDTATNFRSADAIGTIQSQYLVEDYGKAEADSCLASIDMSAPPCATVMQVYRITALSQAPNGAEVVLQSTFEVPIP